MPADPAVRAVALEQVERGLDASQPLRGRGIARLVVGGGFYVALAIAYSPLWLLGAALVAAAPASRSVERRRLTRRVAVLRASDTPMPVDSDI